jgi:serine/threonine protein kinase
MALTSGTKLGPYEIVAPLGAGGMGEVYRARDTRLERDVAIKVLPANVTADSNLRQRLEREAKAVSKLSHPNSMTSVTRTAWISSLWNWSRARRWNTNSRAAHCRRSKLSATPRKLQMPWRRPTGRASRTVI